ncbi:MAG: hypothetical protein HY934_05045 [Candidatus Firestonebacteria bacterium]|nr:hypothetical protein [Candidatus Firestonebacteria bacterium]
MINRKTMLWVFAACMYVMLISTVSWCAENIFYRGMRPMSMGGAFVAVGDDYNARNWNPASLALVKSWDLTFEVTPRISDDIQKELIEASQGKGTIGDAKDAIDASQNDKNPDANNASTKDLMKVIDDISSKLVEGGSDIYTGFSIRPWKFGMGVYINALTRAYIVKSAMSQTKFFGAYSIIDDKIAYNITADISPVVTQAFTIKELIPVPEFISDGDNTDRDLNLGINMKYLYRGKFNNENDPLTILDIASSASNNKKLVPTSTDEIPIGTGIGMDLGTIIKVNDYLNLGLNIQDIGVTKITYKTKTKGNTTYDTNDEDFPTNLRIGTALKPLKLMGMKDSKAMDMTLAFDLDNLNGGARDNTDFADKTHIGLETKFTLWRDFLGLGFRVGENQGFPTYGLTVNGLWFFSAQYIMYGTDVTDYHTASVGVVF